MGTPISNESPRESSLQEIVSGMGCIFDNLANPASEKLALG
jgi:hypothetical protein